MKGFKGTVVYRPCPTLIEGPLNVAKIYIYNAFLKKDWFHDQMYMFKV